MAEPVTTQGHVDALARQVDARNAERDRRDVGAAEARAVIEEERAPLAEKLAQLDIEHANIEAALSPVRADIETGLAAHHVSENARAEREAAREAEAEREIAESARLESLALAAGPRFSPEARSEHHKAQDTLSWRKWREGGGPNWIAARDAQERAERERLEALPWTVRFSGVVPDQVDVLAEFDGMLRARRDAIAAPLRAIDEKIAALDAAVATRAREREADARLIEQAQAELAEHDRQLLAALARSGVKLVPKDARP